MEFSEALRRRRMSRDFATTPLSTDVVERILAAAFRAPSAGNVSATELLVLEGPVETARYWDVTLPVARRSTFAWPGLLRAPLVVLVLVEAEAYVRRYGEDDKAATGLGAGPEVWSVPYWFVDGAFSAMCLQLAAIAEGLGCLFFGVFDHEAAVLDALGVPAGWRAVGTVVIGHPLPDAPGRSAGRPRRSVAERVHRGRW